MLYTGAAGVIWALDHLAREGAAEPGPTFAEHLPRILIDNHASMAGIGFQTRSLLIGDAGVLLTQWKTGPSDAVREALAQVVTDNTNDPALELMWGAPGDHAGGARPLSRGRRRSLGQSLPRLAADALEASLLPDETLGADIWTQTLYGTRGQYLGPVHGFAGNAYVLVQGRDLLSPDQGAGLSQRIGPHPRRRRPPRAPGDQLAAGAGTGR